MPGDFRPEDTKDPIDARYHPSPVIAELEAAGRGCRTEPVAKHPGSIEPRAESYSPVAKICHPKKRAFLTAYAQTGNKSLAAKMAGIVKQTIYTRQWREDRKFQAALERARVMAADVLEAEAHRRAMEGVEEPVGWHMGVPGGYVRRYSDVLLMFLTKGALPDRYRERVEVRGALASIDLTKLTDEQLARISAGEHPFSVLANALGRGLPRDALLGLPAASEGAGEAEDGDAPHRQGCPGARLLRWRQRCGQYCQSSVAPLLCHCSSGL